MSETRSQVARICPRDYGEVPVRVRVIKKRFRRIRGTCSRCEFRAQLPMIERAR